MKTFFFSVALLCAFVTYGQRLSLGDIRFFLKSQDKDAIGQKLESLRFIYIRERETSSGKRYSYQIKTSSGDVEQLEFVYDDGLLTDDPQFNVFYYLTNVAHFNNMKKELVNSVVFVYDSKDSKDSKYKDSEWYKSRNNKVLVLVRPSYTKAPDGSMVPPGFMFSVPLNSY